MLRYQPELGLPALSELAFAVGLPASHRIELGLTDSFGAFIIPELGVFALCQPCDFRSLSSQSDVHSLLYQSWLSGRHPIPAGGAR